MTRTSVALGRAGAARTRCAAPSSSRRWSSSRRSSWRSTSAASSDTTRCPGFPPVRGFLDFQLAAAITQSLLLGGVSVGHRHGAGDRGRLLRPARGLARSRASAIVLGRLAGPRCIAAIQVAFFLALGLVFGATIDGGVPGALVVSWHRRRSPGSASRRSGVLLALRARNASIVQGIFPLVFVVLFLSSAFFPRALLLEPARRSPPTTRSPTSPTGCATRSSRRCPPRRCSRASPRPIGWRVVMTLLAVPALADRLRTLIEARRADLRVVRALMRRALNEIAPRAGRRRSPACWRRRSSSLGLSSVFCKAPSCAGYGGRELPLLHHRRRPPAGRGLHRRGDGREPRARHRAGWFDRLLLAPVPRAGAPGRHRGLRRAAGAAAGELPVPASARSSASTWPGLGRDRADGAARSAATRPSRPAAADHRPALPHAAGGAADADRRLRRDALHDGLRPVRPPDAVAGARSPGSTR